MKKGTELKIAGSIFSIWTGRHFPPPAKEADF